MNANATTLYGLLDQSRAVLDGLKTTGAAMNVDILAGPIEQAILRTETAINVALTARTAHKGNQETRRTALGGVRAFVRDAMTDFRILFGAEWNPKWEAIGFLRGRTKAPTKVTAMLELARRMQEFQQANPAQENTSRNLTAARISGLLDNYEAANSVAARSKGTLRTKADERNAAAAQLRKVLTSTRATLGTYLSPEDYRWNDFGYSRPSDPATPGTPGNVVVTTTAAGKATVTWDRAIRAQRYRVFLQGPGEEAPIELQGTAVLRTFELKGLIPGVTYQVYVAAVNAAGESIPSDPVQITV